MGVAGCMAGYRPGQKHQREKQLRRRIYQMQKLCMAGVSTPVRASVRACVMGFESHPTESERNRQMNKSPHLKFPETREEQIASRVARINRFREGRPRIDYFPSNEAQSAIEIFMKHNPQLTFQAALDDLILRGASVARGST